eukprot:EG_transcript_717
MRLTPMPHRATPPPAAPRTRSPQRTPRLGTPSQSQRVSQRVTVSPSRSKSAPRESQRQPADVPATYRPKICARPPTRSKSISDTQQQARVIALEGLSTRRSLGHEFALEDHHGKADHPPEEQGQAKHVLWSSLGNVHHTYVQGYRGTGPPTQPPASRSGPYLHRDPTPTATTAAAFQRPTAPLKHRGRSPSATVGNSSTTPRTYRSPRQVDTPTLKEKSTHHAVHSPHSDVHALHSSVLIASPASSQPATPNYMPDQYSIPPAAYADPEPIAVMPSRYSFVASRSTITASPSARSRMVASPLRASTSPGRSYSMAMALAGCATPSDPELLSNHLSSSPAVRFERPKTPEELVGELRQAHHSCVESPNKRDGEVAASEQCKTPERSRLSDSGIDASRSRNTITPEGSPQRRGVSPMSPSSPGRKPSPSRRSAGVQRKTFAALPPVTHWPRIQDVLHLMDTWRDGDSWDPMDKYAAVLLLSNVASDSSSHPVLEEHDCIGFLSHLLGDAATTPEQRLAATFALQNLANSPSKTLQARIAKAEAVVHLVRLLRSGQPSEPAALRELQSAGARTLRAIAFVSEEAKQVIVAEGGVLALADLLRRDAPEILAEAVPALRTLSFSALPGTDDSFIVACGPLLRLVTDPAVDMGIREGAAGALQNLSMWAAVRQQLAAQDGIPALLRLLAQRATSELALESIAIILSNVAGDEPSQGPMLDAGAIPALLDNLDFCDTPSSTKAHLMATLHKLLADKKARQQVCQLGGVNIIVRELWIGGDAPAIQTYAAGAITHLAMDTAMRAELGVTGAASALLNLLTSPPSVEALTNAAGALGFLCINDADNKQRVWQLGGVDIMLGILEDAEAPDRIVMPLGECLQTLSVEPEGAQVLIAAGGAKVLLDVIVRSRLRVHDHNSPSSPTTPVLTRAGARCRLETLLADPASHRAVFKRDIVDDSSDSEAEEELQTKSIVCPAVATLQNLSIFPKGAKAIIEAGGAPIMKQLLRSEGNLRMIRDCAVGVLSNLLLEDSCQAAVLQEDGIPLFALRLYNPEASQYEKETILEMFLDLALGPYTASMLECGLVMVLVCILEELKVALRLKRLACGIVCKLATKRSHQATLMNARCLPALARFLHAYHHPAELRDAIELTMRALQSLPSWLTWRPRDVGEDGGDVAEPPRPQKALRKKKGVKSRSKPRRERRATLETSDTSPRIAWSGMTAAARRSSINVSPGSVPAVGTLRPPPDWG